jgi:adhesin transport system outer membrane protein
MPALAPTKGTDAKATARNALLQDPAVREAASLVSASADEVRIQRAVLFPSLGIAFGGGIGDAGDGSGVARIEGKQLILDFGDTKRAVTAADLDLQINYISFQQTVDTALVELLTAYDAVAVNDQLLDVRTRQLAAMRELERLVAAQTEGGAASAPDLLETRKRLQTAEFMVNDAELALAEAHDRLARLGGPAQGGALPKLSGNCAKPSISDDLQMAKLRHARATITLARAERARLPRAYVSPLAKSDLDGGGVSLGLNLGIDSDLIQGGAYTARANAARNKLEGAIAGVAAAERDFDLDTSKYKRDQSAADFRIGMLDRQIDLVDEARDLYRSQYFDLGTRRISELLDNEEEYYSLLAEKIETQASLTETRLQCAARDRSLRRSLGLEGNSLYGLPLDPDAI